MSECHVPLFSHSPNTAFQTPMERGRITKHIKDIRRDVGADSDKNKMKDEERKGEK